ncbi:MAG: hypothetical protein ACLRWQ_01575 [Flavonifractor plautii]
MDRKAPRALAERLIEELEIVTPGVDTPVRRLSGGNVQKVLVGREIASNPIGAYDRLPRAGAWTSTPPTPSIGLLNEQKMKGVAVILVGEDLDVLLELCDRILVAAAAARSPAWWTAATPPRKRWDCCMTHVGGGKEAGRA